MLIAVNYHYVRPSFDHPYPSIYGVTPSQLKSQLETLGGAGVFVSAQQVAEAVKGARRLPDNSILVTFDDGLREQYDIAWPVLERLGIPAVFFANTFPIANRMVSQVHKIHLLRAHIAPAEFLSSLRRQACQLGIELELQEAVEEAIEQYPYDTPENARLKHLLNFLLPPFDRERLVDTCFDEAFPGQEAEISGKLYMDVEQIRSLGRQGCLGSHAHEHVPLGLLPSTTVEEQIRLSLLYLERWAGARPFAMSYPYGSREACSSEVGEIAARLGISFALTMERAGNINLDHPLHLARFDSNDLPVGNGHRPDLQLLFEKLPTASWCQ